MIGAVNTPGARTPAVLVAIRERRPQDGGGRDVLLGRMRTKRTRKWFQRMRTLARKRYQQTSETVFQSHSDTGKTTTAH